MQVSGRQPARRLLSAVRLALLRVLRHPRLFHASCRALSYCNPCCSGYPNSGQWLVRYHAQEGGAAFHEEFRAYLKRRMEQEQRTFQAVATKRSRAAAQASVVQQQSSDVSQASGFTLAEIDVITEALSGEAEASSTSPEQQQHDVQDSASAASTPSSQSTPS